MYRVTVYAQAYGTITSEFFSLNMALEYLKEHARSLFHHTTLKGNSFPDFYAVDADTLEEVQTLLKPYASNDFIITLTEHDLTLREEMDQLTGGNEHGNKI